MSNKMLIDATHPEETRVVVLRGGRVEEFDYESAARKLLRGNIYLAKVTRVEPSLQAAFVDYGGNRHGFLAFNEIHPDYYQIPMADRQALLDEEAAAEAEEEAAADARAEAMARRRARADAREARGDDEGNGNHRGGRRGRDRDRGRGRNRDRDADGEHEAAPRAVDPEREDGDGEGYPAADISHVHDEAHDEAPETIESAGVVPHDDHDHGVHHDDRAPARESHARDTHRDSPAREATGLADHVHAEEVRGEPEAAPDAHHRDAHHHAADPADTHTPADDTARPVADDASVVIATLAEAANARVVPPSREDGDSESDGDAEGESEDAEAEAIDQVGSEDAQEEVPVRPRRRPRSYKIQEVIKRRQVILIQVVKEERGNKGAALTTYLSLAGRYTVLMPNTARGGGISRKITQPQDRKRLKAIAAELEVPEGMGLIIRTAGAARTKQEIKRDFEYLLRLWESVRELTLQSVAPSLVYEEGNLIKRSIRDLYNKDVEEIIVAGREAHIEAHDFMRMLMPSHAKNVIEYREPEPLFTRYQIERQLNAMFSPYVTLRSGGYLVINQTEALVAVDVNSGKSTREFSIEETALNTNLEAAEEIARQLKLRDLAGLIVIDFIDMEERRNNRKVENRLKDALRFDRARIQVGRISHFGLLEMSRQRLRTGVLEGSTSQCPHCQGTGIIRSTESVALAVLRGLEDAIMGGARTSLVATTTPTVALYILNHKRQFIIEMEKRTGLPVVVQGSDKVQGANFTIEKGAAPQQVARRPDRAAVNMDWGFEGEDDADASGEVIDEANGSDGNERGERGERSERSERGGDERGESREARDGNGEERRGRRRRRRRGGRRGEGREGGDDRARGQGYDDREGGQRHDFAPGNDEPGGDADDDQGPAHADDHGEPHDHDEAGAADDMGTAASGERAQSRGDGDGDRPRRGRRRGRRGGRRNRERGEGQGDAAHAEPHDAANDDMRPDDLGGDADGHRDVAYEHEAEGVAIALGEPGDVNVPSDGEPQPDFGSLHERSKGGDRPARTGRHERQHPRREARGHRGDSEPRGEREHRRDAPVADTPQAGAPAEPVKPAAVEPPKAAELPPPEAPAAAAPAPERRSRGEPVSSEPKIERLVVSADKADATPEAVPEPAKPTRKGWWNRALGLE